MNALTALILVAVASFAGAFTPAPFPTINRLTNTHVEASSLFAPPPPLVEKRLSEEIKIVPNLVPEKSLDLQELTDGEFASEVLETAGLSVVLFSSSWCSPCQDMKQTILSKCMPKHGSRARFFVVDTDFESEAVNEFGVRSIPSTILFKDGQVVSDIVGNVDFEVLNQQIIKNF